MDLLRLLGLDAGYPARPVMGGTGVNPTAPVLAGTSDVGLPNALLYGSLNGFLEIMAASLGQGSASLPPPSNGPTRENFALLEQNYANNLAAYFGSPQSTGGHELTLATAGGSKPVMATINTRDPIKGRSTIDLVDGSSPESAARPRRVPLPKGIDPDGMPKLYGVTPQEAIRIYRILSRVPEKDRLAVRSIVVHNVPGVNFTRSVDPQEKGRDVQQGVIEVSRQDLQLPRKGQHTLLHEVGHAVADAYGLSTANRPWGRGQFVTDYARTGREHDFAETYAAYYGVDPALKERIDPQKEKIIKTGKESLRHERGTRRPYDAAQMITDLLMDHSPLDDAMFLSLMAQRSSLEQSMGMGANQIRQNNFLDLKGFIHEQKSLKDRDLDPGGGRWLG